jgi:hypothetical protein
MTAPVRTVAFILSLLFSARPAAGSTAVPDTTTLQFYGFRAGARIEEMNALLQRLDGSRLTCERARADRRVSECRSVLRAPKLGAKVRLWISAVDSVASVITLSANVETAQLDSWRRDIEHRYGRVGAQAQGSQWMMQWVRRGRMLRLTWRMDRGQKIASVSLVDGRVLDDWGRSRTRAASTRPS